MSTLRIGELFAGYGGLGMGARAVFGGEIAWFSELDAAPSKILAHHWPDLPNHGDITKIDWSQVAPVDILTGGFPCQDVSLAGARKGISAGTRSGLWSEFARAIAALRPGLVVIENVRGLLSASAGGSVEPDPWGVGDGATRPSNAGRVGSERRGGQRDGDAVDHRSAIDRAATAWGDYEPAIRRWERVTGRVAPSPTLPDGKGGAYRLSAPFAEWMMGLPDGHVTDPAIGLTRNEELKVLGNGVVWQQAALALGVLMRDREVSA